jgi:antitoxin (DNA-binding transcriptional repressor) of toxin-antitoxin stability system
MEIVTVKEFQERFDELIERVENGEHIGIVDEEGRAGVMIPSDDELMKLYVETNNEAP